MTDEGTTPETGGTQGQPGGETGGSQTTATPGPGSAEGQSGAAGSQETTRATTGTETTAEETFFDPKDLTPELMPAYKNMQKAFSKKTEGIKADRQKIEAYDAFMTDPMNQLQQLAGRYGYQLNRLNDQGDGQHDEGDWQPQNWNEVISRSKKEAREEVLSELKPIFGEIKDLRKNSMEKMLDETCPDWRTYEDEMMANLQTHPTLVKDPAKLYQLSVPAEVMESLATQRALKKLQAKTDTGRIQGASTRKDQGAQMPDKAVSFADAVALAKAKLAEEGITK